MNTDSTEGNGGNREGKKRFLTQRPQRGGAATKRKEQKSRQKNGGRKILTQRTQRNAEKRRAEKSRKGIALRQRHSAAKKATKEERAEGQSKKWRQKDFTAEAQPTGPKTLMSRSLRRCRRKILPKMNDFLIIALRREAERRGDLRIRSLKHQS